MDFLRQKKGIAHVGVLMLLLVVGVLVATVYVAKNGTDLGSFATKKSKQTYQGQVQKLPKCIQRGVCHQLVKTTDGASHYLAPQSGILDKKIDLNKYVGQNVSVSGVEWVRTNITYLVVSNIEKRQLSNSLSVAEFGVVQKLEAVGPVPIEVPGTEPGASENDRRNGTTVIASDCTPRPACLDAKPYACKVIMPENGWCPTRLPTTVTTQYSLLTADGRIYNLSTKSSACPPGAMCATIWNGPDLESFLGKTVLVEGTVTKSKTPVNCPTIYPPLPGCGEPIPDSWWPLPDGLEFEVMSIQEAWEISPKITLKDSIIKTATKDDAKRVYQFVNLKPCTPQSFPCVVPITGAKPIGGQILVRSSEINLAAYVGQTLDGVGSVYGTKGGEVYFNVVYANNTPVPVKLNKISWKTDSGDVTLSADDFYIDVGGKRFYAKAKDLRLHSDPPDSCVPSAGPNCNEEWGKNYTTLEAEWTENNVPMRFYIYFHKNGSTWWTDEMRTYDGTANFRQVYFYEKRFESPVGQTYSAAEFYAKSNKSESGVNGVIYFKNLKLKAFAKLNSICKVGLDSFAVSNDCGGGSFRQMSYRCYDGTKGTMGGSTSCKPSELWQKYAKDACAGKSSCTVY